MKQIVRTFKRSNACEQTLQPLNDNYKQFFKRQ